MSEPAKILILYARFGEGHWQAAAALRQSFSKLGHTEVRLVDLLEEAHPVLNGISRYVYHKSYSVLPQAYGWVYEKTKTMKPNSLFASWLHSMGAQTLRKLLERERPHAIIHTFPTLAFAQLTRSMMRSIPVYNVLTDFDLHYRWIHPEVNKYFVATEDIRRQLCDLGVDPRRVAATGIPVRADFVSLPSTPERHRIILVMANAGLSAASTARLCKQLVQRCHSRVIIVCGRKEAFRRALEGRLNANPDIDVLGYTERLQEWMAVASCIVTKPGGLTLSEAIAAELPIYLYRPVPGQERNNARYLASKGAAVVCNTIAQLADAVFEHFAKPESREILLRGIRALRKSDASDAIALDIAGQLHIMEEASQLRRWQQSDSGTNDAMFDLDPGSCQRRAAREQTIR
jgi:processive 1,2-diacylglycerol beta-glucosyltransferase